MDELARSRRGARRPVTSLDERRIQPTRDRIDRRPGAHHAAAYDEHIELVAVCHRGERRLTLGWPEPSGHLASHMLQTFVQSSPSHPRDLCRTAGSSEGCDVEL